MKIKLSILIAVVVSLSGLAVGYSHLHKPKSNIAKADIDFLVKSIVKEIASQELSKDEVRTKTQESLASLDQAIQAVAKQKGVIVLNSKAVLAGGSDIDITSEVATKFNEQGQNDQK